jgi:serine/threonine protein kinase
VVDKKSNPDAAIFGLPKGRPANLAQGREPLEVLATKFLDAIREGKRPAVDAYAAQNPDLASEIQELFPLLAAMEKWKDYRESNSFEHRTLTSLPNDRLGNYQIVREIGRGGQGIVFEATDLPAHSVAIKVLPFLKSTALQAGFEHEAKTAARLHHAHIVPVYNFGEHNGLCYSVMRLIHGVGLDWIIERLAGKEGIVYPHDILARFEGPAAEHTEADRLEEESTTTAMKVLPASPEGHSRFKRGLSRNSWFDMARIGAQVAEALNYAHSAGTLHRDIKPANLLLDANGDIWITDFGLAQNINEPVEHEDARAAGTLRYIAPEQFAGKVDVRSDIYALGVTLFELLTRTPAFAVGTRQTMIESIVHSPVPRPRAVNKKVPRDLDAIVSKATAKDPALRYGSAAEMWADLLRFLRGQRVHASGTMGWLRIGRSTW